MNDYILYIAVAVLILIVLFVSVIFIKNSEEASGLRKIFDKLFGGKAAKKVKEVVESNNSGFVVDIPADNAVGVAPRKLPSYWSVDACFNRIITRGRFDRENFKLSPNAAREVHYLIGSTPNSDLKIEAINVDRPYSAIAYIRYNKPDDSFYLWAINSEIFTDPCCTAELSNNNIKLEDGLVLYLHGDNSIRFTAPADELSAHDSTSEVVCDE